MKPSTPPSHINSKSLSVDENTHIFDSTNQNGVRGILFTSRWTGGKAFSDNSPAIEVTNLDGITSSIKHSYPVFPPLYNETKWKKIIFIPLSIKNLTKAGSFTGDDWINFNVFF